ncbi:MAG: helix-turn-helix domain-containing protein [Actinomycetota bacterium]|nr:helix-turn-helix domain-containing protein [Actinomycetota bacterium]
MSSPVRRLQVTPDPVEAPVVAEIDPIEAVADAVESGAGLPVVVRAAGRALDCSLALLDTSGSPLAVDPESPADEQLLLTAGAGVEDLELRVAGQPVGRLRLRARGASPSTTLVTLVRTLLASEAERVRAPERASEQAVSGFLCDLLARRYSSRDELLAAGAKLGAALESGGSIVVAHAQPLVPTDGDWRRRVLTVAERGARGAVAGALAALAERPDARPGEIVLLVPGEEDGAGRRVADAVLRELRANLYGYGFVVGRSRAARDPLELARAGKEALLAANVAMADGASTVLAFEDMGAYTILLTSGPEELQRFYAETVEPIRAYDEQYESGWVRTLETFLDCDGNVAQTAERLFAHRHTIRYRLKRVHELSGIDILSSDGRERLSLGLKAMRVLGIAAPGGPASEPGTEGGRVPGGPQERSR